MTDKALVVGEALIDVVSHDGQPLGEHVGGSPLNVAFGLALLDRPVEFLTWIGDDPRGRRIADYLHDSGVALAPGSQGASRTGTAHAELDEKGSAQYTFDLEWVVSPQSAPTARPVLHTGSIATALQPGADGVETLIETYAPTTTITFDPNIRPEFFANPEEALANVESIVAKSDVVKASDEDMRWLAPNTSPEDLAARWLALGPAMVAVTLGADGSYAVCADGSERIPAYPTEVVDTVGAGDAFMTGLVDALWSAELLGGHRREHLRRITTDQLRQVLKVAALSAALTVARPGAALPDRAMRDRAAARLVD
ncbi:carbohydrate kinase family protein [Mycolicibacterium hodleri]|uniref:Carbohydrate kinase n=1 Tax=Mycolicibacterium hodleri TaxID=49897 RepID=A0A502DSY5_9MYCO|nr:carbohydrate kinase [Mycolicibacterium hodleri]TPG27392.1 carbohydrate kinase [Mycolicibacterium hodleri]